MNKGQVVNQGRIIVIVAPSGAGKSTLIKRLKQDFSMLEESVSCTTRKMREGEINGVHYHFISREDFDKKVAANDFLEWAHVHGNCYGTSKKFVEDRLKQGAKILFDLDVQGADAMKKHFGSLAKVIFIAPPSIEELEKRLRNRGTDSEEVIKLRIENASKELLRKEDYDFWVLNDELERAHQEMRTIFNKILMA